MYLKILVSCYRVVKQILLMSVKFVLDLLVRKVNEESSVVNVLELLAVFPVFYKIYQY